MARKRTSKARAMVINKVAGDKEGNNKGGKGNSNSNDMAGNKEGDDKGGKGDGNGNYNGG